MLNTDSKNVADAAARWLESEPGTGKHIWVYAASEKEGLDITHRIARSFRTAFSATEIAYDQLPARLVNPATGNEVFVLCQPDHIDPIMTSLQEVDLGEFQERIAGREEFVLKYGEVLDASDFQVRVLDPNDPSAVAVRRLPSQILVDNERPFWEQLAGLVGRHTHVYETGRVQPEHSILAAIARRKQQN